jgi:signal transduction histidine kinase
MVVYLILGFFEIAESFLFPIDAIWWLLGCAISGAFLRTGRVQQASYVMIASLIMPLPYLTIYHGVNHAVNYAFLVPIVMSGLVIGGRTMVALSVFSAVYLSVAAYGELSHWYLPPRPVYDVREFITRALLWTAVFMQAGWLVWLLDRTVDRIMHVSQGQASTLVRAANALAQSPDVDRMLSEVASAMVEQLHASHASLWIHDASQGALTEITLCENGIGVLPVPNPVSVPAEGLSAWELLQQHRMPIVLDQQSIDAALAHAPICPEGVKTLLLAPLLLGDELLGWVSIGSSKTRRFGSHDIDLVVSQAPAFLIALQLQKQAHLDQDAAVMEERNRMAREIHDTLAQGFAAIVIQLDLAQELMSEDPASSRQRILRAQRMARESLAEARRSLSALRSTKLDGADLSHAFRRLALQLKADHSVEVTFHIVGEQRRLPVDVEAHLLRIGQEAATNALKHAEASSVRIELTYGADSVSVAVHDDGKGFDPHRTLVIGDRFGLTGMQERAKRLGGKLDVQSSPGHGTRVEVSANVA